MSAIEFKPDISDGMSAKRGRVTLHVFLSFVDDESIATMRLLFLLLLFRRIANTFACVPVCRCSCICDDSYSLDRTESAELFLEVLFGCLVA